jgi:hypothetical protein
MVKEITKDCWEFRRNVFILYTSEAVLDEVADGRKILVVMQRILAAAQLSRYQFQTTCDACGGKLRVENALKMSARSLLSSDSLY